MTALVLADCPAGSHQEFCDMLRVEQTLLDMPLGRSHRFDRGPVSVVVRRSAFGYRVLRLGIAPLLFDPTEHAIEVARYIVNAAGAAPQDAGSGPTTPGEVAHIG